MTRWFNIAGPCFPSEHYMIPPERRAREAVALIEQGRWFALVSGRQTGKTTVVQHLAKSLSRGSEQRVLWVDLETARGLEDTGAALPVILAALQRTLARDAPDLVCPDGDLARFLSVPEEALVAYLGRLVAASERPVVLLLDEADVLAGSAMVSFLTQLRAVYLARAFQPAPRSVVLIGTRAIRDFVMGDDGQRGLPWLGTASPFNVTVENVTLKAFTLAAWQVFWRKDGHLAAEGFGYREPGPHLMLMAFLQRVVNGGGHIEREYALGRGALDLLITWKTQRIALEVKLRRDTETEAEALEQLTRYLTHLDLDEGWLVLFDLRAGTPWETRLFHRTDSVDGRRIHVVGS